MPWVWVLGPLWSAVCLHALWCLTLCDIWSDALFHCTGGVVCVATGPFNAFKIP